MRYLDKHAAREKHLRSLERELDRLRKAQGAAPIIPLSQPYQRGWVKTYVLRDDVQRRPDAAVFRSVLAVVNKRVHSKDRDFVAANGKPIVLCPHMVRIAAWRKLGWPASHQRLFSYGHWRLDDDESWIPLRHRRLILGFKLTSTWWLVEEVQPLMITHQKIDLPEVKQRLAAIDAFMTATQGWRRLNRLHGRRCHWHPGVGSPATQRADYAFSQQIAEAERAE